MPRRHAVTVLLCFYLSHGSALSVANAADEPKAATKAKVSTGSFSEQISPFVAKYCVSCHGATKPKADLNLTSYTDETSVLRGRKLWTRLKEYLEAGEMPPEKAKTQPGQDEVDAVIAWIDQALAKVNCQSQADPGRVTIRRLNRAEYNNTIHATLSALTSARPRTFRRTTSATDSTISVTF